MRRDDGITGVDKYAETLLDKLFCIYYALLKKYISTRNDNIFSICNGGDVTYGQSCTDKQGVESLFQDE